MTCCADDALPPRRKRKEELTEKGAYVRSVVLRKAEAALKIGRMRWLLKYIIE
jgi:hypothetical protein